MSKFEEYISEVEKTLAESNNPQREAAIEFARAVNKAMIAFHSTHKDALAARQSATMIADMCAAVTALDLEEGKPVEEM